MPDEHDELPAPLLRAALLSGLPGARLAEICERCGVKKSALQRARKLLGAVRLRPSADDLVIAALTNHGVLTDGELPANLDSLASYVDYVNHDGCDAAQLRAMLTSLVACGVLAIDGQRWRLLRAEWPA